MKFSKVLLILLIARFADSYKILLLLPFPGPSHFLMFKVFIKEFVNRGHEVTAITAFPLKEKLANYTEILIEPFYQFKDFSQDQIYEMKFGGEVQMLNSYWEIGLESTEHALKTEAVKNFIRNDKSKFDLILAEQFFQEAMLMFAHKYKAPILTFSTYGYSDFMDRTMGSLTPYSFIPHMVLKDYDDNMNFYERAHNFMFSMLDVVLRRYQYMPAQDKLAQEHFGSFEGPLPSVFELEKSISMILINGHFAMIKPRPLMPGIINVGGAHIQPVKPLPDDLQTFLDGAEHGAIFMSLGSFMQSSMMPQEKKEMILSVFGSLKQRVLWKFETDDLPALPSNIMVRKWLPQSDILAHPKLVLFIAHGGLFGSIEASSRGVPVLFMPFFGDQYRNAKLAVNRGYAQTILFSDLTIQLFRYKIDEMISNKKYLKTAKEVSKLMNDNPLKPMDEAMYWIEYVIRNNGAKHLKSIAVDLPWYKYLLLDVIGAILISLWLLWKILFILKAKLFKKKENNFNNKKKKN